MKYTKSKIKTRPGVSELEHKDEDGEKKLAQEDRDKAEVLKGLSSVFTEEPPGPLPLFEEGSFQSIFFQSTLADIDINVESVI